MGMVILIGMLIGLAVMLVFVGVAQTQALGSTDRLDDYVSDQLAHTRPRPARRSARLRQSANELAQGIDKILRSVSALDELAYALQRADLRLTVAEYLVIWLFSLTGAAGLGYLISHHWLPAGMAGLLGAFVPHFFVRFRQGSRLRAFNNQLGTVLMQLAGSMRAGYGLLQAVDYVAHELPPPAGIEFAQVVRDVKLGSTLMDALDDLAERVGSDDLTLIVTAILIHHETGGNLAEILETVSETIRERVRIKGELWTLTAQQRLSGYALAALPIIMFFVLMLINPEYESHLFAPGLTLCIPIGAVLSMLMGLWAIRYIITVEV
jgi:tight adherence protein B